MTSNKAARVSAFMLRIAPEGGLESMLAEPRVREVSQPPWASAEEVEHAVEGLRRLEAREPLERPQADALEAIILPQERPVVDVVDGTFATPEAPFAQLGEGAARATIEAALPSIGRIDLPGHPTLPYGGTGFVVGDDLLMTNRHVAELFASGVGREELSFRPGRSAAIDFRHELGRAASQSFRIARVLMVHPYWDMALLATEGLDAVPALRLAVATPEELAGRTVAVVGYPALDPRNDIDLQNRIFRGAFSVKRMQPGLIHGREDIESFGHVVSAITHDSSTLGGNSGSAAVDVASGAVVALHFAGVYLKANYGVPSWELARDRRVVEAGVAFDGAVGGGGGGMLPSDRFWSEADPARRPGEGPVLMGGAPGALSWTVPLELTVQLGPAGGGVSAAGAGVGVAAPAAAATEALVEPLHDDDFSNRRGYDDRFLGLRVPLPRVLHKGLVSHLDDGSHVLSYEHFSVVMNKQRRLALFTASNVDAAPARKEPEPGRDYSRKGLGGLGENDREKWFTDPRIPGLHQLPDKFFNKDRASFDKGHIVRRDDVAWGDTYDEVRRANGDTFHVTNCSPQIADFNQSAKPHGIWGKLENIVLKQAEAERYSLFAGPVLRDDDPIFHGVDDVGAVLIPIPRQFWKIVVAHAADGLQAFAFVLEQDLSKVKLEFAVDAEWRKRMIAIGDLQDRIGELVFPKVLHDADQLGAPGGEAVRAQLGIETVDGG
jgi:endonuclease G